MKLGIVLLFSATLFAQSEEDRQKLNGTWHLGDATWMLEQKPDAFHITQNKAGQKALDIECNTMGRECKTKEAGKAVKVSMWFQGANLIQIETKGTEVVKRRFVVKEDGDTLELELSPIQPAGKPEVVLLKRVTETTAKK